MPIRVLDLQDEINISLQKGDVVYYCRHTSSQAGKNHPNATMNTKPKKLGVVTNVNRNNDKVDVQVPMPMAFVNLNNKYLLFSKDRRVNYSGVAGYFMEVEYRNYTTLKSEIFATAASYVDSSR
tara:strand:- start:568 stop:939 length:372 start_codon:yes stop_codon:yes gene_type:complete